MHKRCVDNIMTFIGTSFTMQQFGIPNYTSAVNVNEVPMKVIILL